MPWAPENQQEGQIGQMPAQVPEERPSVLDVLGAAERTSNVVSMAYDAATQPKPQVAPVKGYDPVTSVPKGMEGYADRFLDSQSPQETAWISQRIRAEMADRDVIRRAGGWGTAATIGFGLTDPLTLASMTIPVAGETRLATMARLAGVNAGTAALQEGVAHELSPTRSQGESLMNVGASAILGGLLGTIAGKVPKAELAKLAENLDADLAPHLNPGEFSTAGAAAVTRSDLAGNTIATGAARTLAEGPIGRVAPGLRVLTSPSNEARELVQGLAETREILQKNTEGVATATPIETQLRQQEGVWWQGWQARAQAFRDYRERVAGDPSAGDPLSRREFNQAIAEAMRRGDEHPIPEVAQAAKDTRRLVFDPMTQRAQKIGLLPEDLTTVGARSYLTRQYDRVKIAKALPDWMARLTQGFVAKGMDIAEARAAAGDATRNILGGERGTMDWNVREADVPGSGRFKQRTLDLPDEVLEPYLNSDIDHLSHSFLRSTAPEVLMTERFGSRDLADQFDKINAEYDRLSAKAEAEGNARAAADLESRRQADIRDLSAMRDRLYGLYGQPKDPGAFFVRAGRLLRADNGLRLLGAATLSHIPDIANVIAKYGLTNTFAAMGKLAANWQAIGMARAEARRIGVGLDMVMNSTAALLGDYGAHSQFLEQRVATKLMRGFTIATGETPLITIIQSLASTIGSDEVLRNAAKLAAGNALSKRTLTALAASGIDQDMLARIATMAERHGEEYGGLKFGHSDLWTDKEAAQAFDGAILKNAHAMTLSPGVGDTPLIMSTEIGKALLQFKSFAFAASRHVLMPLVQGVAQGDVRAATSIMALATAGFMSYAAKQTMAGQPLEQNPQRLAMEVLDKSNFMGWTSEFVFPGMWLMGMKDLSRWSDRDPVETLGGPTAGTLAAAYSRQFPAKLTANTDEGEKGFSRADLHFLRRLVPGQNLWYLRRAVNATEDSMGDLFGLPGTSNKERADQLAANQ